MSDNITTATGSAQLVFVEAPPAATRGRGSDSTAWVAEAQALKLNPEKWAILASFTVVKKAAALAATVNGGKVRAFAPRASSRPCRAPWTATASCTPGTSGSSREVPPTQLVACR